MARETLIRYELCDAGANNEIGQSWPNGMLRAEGVVVAEWVRGGPIKRKKKHKQQEMDDCKNNQLYFTINRASFYHKKHKKTTM